MTAAPKPLIQPSHTSYGGLRDSGDLQNRTVLDFSLLLNDGPALLPSNWDRGTSWEPKPLGEIYSGWSFRPLHYMQHVPPTQISSRLPTWLCISLPIGFATFYLLFEKDLPQQPGS